MSVVLEYDPKILKNMEKIPIVNLDSCKGGVSPEHALLLSYLTHTLNGNILEIGCGCSSGFIFSHLKEGDSFYMIDKNSQKMSYIFNEFTKYTDKVQNFITLSTDSRFIDLKYVNTIFNLLFIDGNHSLSGVINDFSRFLLLLNLDGYVIIHDYNPKTKDSPTKYTVDLFGNFIRDNSRHFGLEIISEVKNPITQKSIVFGEGLFMARKISNEFTYSHLDGYEYD
jgi:hypothetical protein